MKTIKLALILFLTASTLAHGATKKHRPGKKSVPEVATSQGEILNLRDDQVEMHGDQELSDEAKALLPKIKKVQDEVETAYAATKAMGPEAMRMALAAIDSAQALFREVIMMPTSETGLKELEKQRVFEEIFRGHRDLEDKSRDTYGSLVRLFWMTLTHHDSDPKFNFDGKITPYGAFFKSFREVFFDLRGATTFKRDVNGNLVWSLRERSNRERAARNMIVRFFDLNEFANKNEKNDNIYGYISDEGIGVGVDTAIELRNERRSAETISMSYYVGMLLGNLTLAPMLLPIPFIDQNFVGMLTGNIWGSSLISGAIFTGIYTYFTVYKYFNRTQRTFDLLKDLWRVVTDPVKAAAALKKGHEMNEAEEEAARTSYKAFVQSIRDGKGPLGEHRAKMMKLGYDPLKENDLSSCEKAVQQSPY